MKAFELRRPLQGKNVLGVFVGVLLVVAPILTSANADEKEFSSGTTPNARAAGLGLRHKPVQLHIESKTDHSKLDGDRRELTYSICEGFNMDSCCVDPLKPKNLCCLYKPLGYCSTPSRNPGPMPSSIPTLKGVRTPAPVPTPKPHSTTQRTPVPAPQLVSLPMLALQPAPQPAPMPALSPSVAAPPRHVAQPAPQPAPAPATVPSPQPAPVPLPAMIPIPVPASLSAPVPAPATVPSLQPASAPLRSSMSIPAQALQPAPMPAPSTATAPKLVPMPDPAPVAKSASIPAPQSSPKPAPQPTTTPTSLAPTPPAPTPATCVRVDVDFSKAANGTKLSRGDYVSNEWEAYGLTLKATGGYGNRPRVFDTSNPGVTEYGDPDLGSPNELCSPSGPGTGVGGQPKDGDEPGENCSPLGNALIIQEVNDNLAIPDDNVDGGMIEFNFEPYAGLVSDIGLLDVDYKTTVVVAYKTSKGVMTTKMIRVPNLGDNSYQLLPINLSNVKQVKVTMERSAAITSISFCHLKPPILPPRAPPTTCVKVTVDFGSLPGGMYMSDEFAEYGLRLSTKGGLEGETRPRLFNTSDAANSNDHDLGSPNKKCSPAGPGTGKGGEPTGAGPNCKPLGNILIIQHEDPKITIPDDNVNGGTIFFKFDGEAEYVGDIGLLDVDYKTSIMVVWKTANGVMTKSTFHVPLLGDNSYQIFSIDKPNVKQVRLDLTRSGAVSFISFCKPLPRLTPPSSEST